MFEVHCITNYDDGINLGRVIVINNNDKGRAIEFIYMIDENDNWSFHYENYTSLSDEVKTELENWFIECGLK